MIILYHPKELTEAADWKEQLAQMTVAHLIIESEHEVPYLTEGKRRIDGIKAISRFLEEYKTFMATWNQDRCDMWFLDEG
ncbi:MAG: hypothetical protein Roseis2KO_45290 [Roseivirga sp.]